VHRRLLNRPLLVALTAGTLLTACGSAAHHTRIAGAPRPLPSPAAQVPPAGPGAPSAAALPPARSPVGAKTTAQRVTAAVRGATTDPQVQLDVAVVDTGTGMSVHVGAGTPVRAASLTKLVIYLAGPGRGRDPGAAAMIERSDNDAATRLWHAAGGDPALQQVLNQAGIEHTTQAPPLLLPWDGWVTTARDQLRLLKRIDTGSGATVTSLRTLMAQVEPEQNWGAGRVPGASAAMVKNGWLPVGGSWVVNTDGCLTAVNRHRVCVAVTSHGAATMAAGVAQVQAVTDAAVSSLLSPVATG